MARPSKSVTSTLTANNVLDIAEFWGPIIDSMHTRQNVPSADMCMEQMGLTCTKGGVQSVREGHQESGIGRISKIETIRSLQNRHRGK
jgi:hypothetical protein